MPPVNLTAFDLPHVLKGTAFMQKVWNALQDILYGTTVSYGEIAKAARVGENK